MQMEGLTIRPQPVEILRLTDSRCQVFLSEDIRQQAPGLWSCRRYRAEAAYNEGLQAEVTADFAAWLQRAQQDEEEQQQKERWQQQQQQDLKAAASIAFVALAQSGQLDDATIGGRATLFAAWDPNWTGRAGTILRDEGRLYRLLHDVVTPAQNTKPGQTPALWAPVADPAEEWPLWTQPLGAHDAYSAGDKVRHRDEHWVSQLSGNIWEPGVYGWQQAEG